MRKKLQRLRGVSGQRRGQVALGVVGSVILTAASLSLARLAPVGESGLSGVVSGARIGLGRVADSVREFGATALDTLSDPEELARVVTRGTAPSTNGE